MDPSKIALFVVVAVIIVAGIALAKDLRKYFLVLMILFAPMSSGLIFYHYNGAMLMDFPMLALLLMAFAAPEKKFRWSFPIIGIPALAFVGWSLATCFAASNSGWAFSEFTRILRGYLLCVCVANYVNSPARLKVALNALLATFAFQALLGTYQWRYGPLGLTILEEVGYDWRSSGTFIHPGVFGDYLIVLLPLVLRLFAFHRNSSRQMWLAYLMMFVFGMCALLGSYGRGPWVSFAGAVVLTLIYSLPQKRLRPKAKAPIMIMIVLGIAFGIHYAPTITEQFTDDHRKSSADVRAPLNRVAWRMFNDHAIMGVGLGNYRLVSIPYARKEMGSTPNVNWREYAQIVHNSFMLVLTETGALGLLLLLLLILSAFRVGLKSLKIKNAFLNNLSLGLLAGLLGLCISVNTGPNLMNHQILMMFWLVIGFLIAIKHFKISSPVASKKTATPSPEEASSHTPVNNENAIVSESRAFAQEPIARPQQWGNRNSH